MGGRRVLAQPIAPQGGLPPIINPSALAIFTALNHYDVALRGVFLFSGFGGFKICSTKDIPAMHLVWYMWLLCSGMEQNRFDNFEASVR
jgi:hypothetical protein